MKQSSKPVAWVSGASRGIGAALVELLKAQGWVVAGCSRSQGCDVTSEASVRESMRTLVETHKRLDLAVHCAAILGPRGPLAEVEVETMREVLEINTIGAFIVGRLAAEFLSDGGTLILLSSSVGRQGRAGWGPYSISKHGLEGLSDTLAEEYPKLRVFSVNPGGTATDMRREAYPDEDPETLPTAAEVAAVILGYVADTSLQSGAKLNCRDLVG